MVELSPSDLFEIRQESLFSSRDEDYLFDLYSPLVGAKASAFYLAMLHLEQGVTYSHEDFLSRGQSSIGEFVSALPALEAVGLVATYFKKGEKFNYFVYCLYAPKTPKEFFDNILFIGTLRKYLDNDKINALAKKYSLLPPPEGFSNVSESFRAYFSPNLNDPSYQQGTLSSGGRSSGSISTGFDKNAFLRSLLSLDPRFNEGSFSKEEMIKIARLAALYSYSEEAMAGFCKDHYDFAASFGSRLDFDGLEQEAQDHLSFTHLHSEGSNVNSSGETLHGDGAVASVVRSMDKLTPTDYLSRLQHGNKPAPADLRLLHELVVDMGLSQGACNALILYMMVNNNGILSKSYMEKIAGGMVRANLSNALDAMNYLTSTAKRHTSAAPKKTTSEAPAAPSPAVSSPDEAISDSDFNDLMSNLYTPTKK
jgi:replication initiation and membrane attachment protein